MLVNNIKNIISLYGYGIFLSNFCYLRSVTYLLPTRYLPASFFHFLRLPTPDLYITAHIIKSTAIPYDYSALKLL